MRYNTIAPLSQRVMLLLLGSMIAASMKSEVSTGIKL